MFDEKKYKQQYNKEKYTRLYIDIDKKTAEVFKHKLSLLGINRATFFKEIIFDFIKDMKISYDLEELIDEIKNDIAEFGDIEMYAFIDYIADNEFIVNYDFIEEEKPLTEEEKNSCDRIIKLPATEILRRLEKQNEIC